MRRILLDRSCALGGAVLLGLISLTLANTSSAQERSAAGLVRFLIHQSDQQQKDTLGIFNCGQAVADQTAARSLVKLGDSALPEIEKELEKIQQRGRKVGDGSPWLQLAYARIRGPAGFSRLRRMEVDSNVGVHRSNVDGALALSLFLTSYVSDSRPLLRNIRCTRGPEPRDALDQFILAWEKDDRQWLEASLAPRAKIALNSLLAGKTWADLRSELWPTNLSANAAVGYRFAIAGRWSEPVETLDDPQDNRDLILPENPDLDTLFKSRSGTDCGKLLVKFIKTEVGVGPGYLMYLVDNSDLRNLLQVIGSCAAKD